VATLSLVLWYLTELDKLSRFPEELSAKTLSGLESPIVRMMSTMVPNGSRETYQEQRDFPLGSCKVLKANLGPPLKHLQNMVLEQGMTPFYARRYRPLGQPVIIHIIRGKTNLVCGGEFIPSLNASGDNPV
jgi:hypothetical protein